MPPTAQADEDDFADFQTAHETQFHSPKSPPNPLSRAQYNAAYDSDEELMPAQREHSKLRSSTSAAVSSSLLQPHTTISSSKVAGKAAPPLPDCPPTLCFCIPLPETPFGIKADAVPPFILYSPLAAPLQKPAEGQSETISDKVVRTWQEQQKQAKESPNGLKNTALNTVSKVISYTKNSRVEFLNRTPAKGELSELRILYPPSLSPQDLRSKFSELIKAVKAQAIKTGIISTAIMPFVLVFDTVTFIPGPFEANVAWAVSNWIGAARATSMSASLTSGDTPINFVPCDLLESFEFRLAELCKEHAKPETPLERVQWKGKEPPMQGVELAAVTLAVATTHLGMVAHEQFETNLQLLSEDIELVLTKGAKEWLAAIEQ